MYQPTAFREDRLEVQQELIRAHPFATLVTQGMDGPEASHLPILLDPEASALGTLRAHLARANDHWRNLDPRQPALMIFQGAESYITPSWYPSKREHGKVVPTWNYAVVHAWGRPRIVEDHDWLRRQIEALAALREAVRPEPWAVSDAPEPFVAAQLKAIVGIEIAIDRIEGKWKVSQNRPAGDRAGVAAGLANDLAAGSRAMAELVAERGATTSIARGSSPTGRR